MAILSVLSKKLPKQNLTYLFANTEDSQPSLSGSRPLSSGGDDNNGCFPILINTRPPDIFKYRICIYRTARTSTEGVCIERSHLVHPQQTLADSDDCHRRSCTILNIPAAVLLPRCRCRNTPPALSQFRNQHGGLYPSTYSR